jgi:hypothetical protein
MTNSSGVMITASWGCYWKIPVFWTDQLSEQIWALSSPPMEIWKNLEYNGPRKIYNLSNEG